MAYTQLHHLKKVCEKLWSKKHLFREQGLKELEAKEQKEKNSVKVESLAALVAY